MGAPVIIHIVAVTGVGDSVTKWANANGRWIALIIVVVFIGLGWYERRRSGQRRVGLASFARHHGLKFSREESFALPRRNLRLFQLGDGRGCENVIQGKWKGLPAREADYWYYKESRDDQGRVTQSYKYFFIVMADLGATVPYVSIQKELAYASWGPPRSLRHRVRV